MRVDPQCFSSFHCGLFGEKAVHVVGEAVLSCHHTVCMCRYGGLAFFLWVWADKNIWWYSITCCEEREYSNPINFLVPIGAVLILSG